MFQHSFQTGICLEILSTQGNNPLKNTKTVGNVQKLFDKSVRGYVFVLDSNGSNKIQIPKDDKQSLALSHNFLVLQLMIPIGKSFSIELQVSDSSKSHRRLLFSSTIKEVISTALHGRIPLHLVKRNIWLNLSLDIGSFVWECFKTNLRTIDNISISSHSRIRRVFVMHKNLMDTTDFSDSENITLDGTYASSANYSSSSTEAIPKSLEFPLGISFQNQCINYYKICPNTSSVPGAQQLGAITGTGFGLGLGGGTIKGNNSKGVKIAFGSKVPGGTLPANMSYEVMNKTNVEAYSRTPNHMKPMNKGSLTYKEGEGGDLDIIRDRDIRDIKDRDIKEGHHSSSKRIQMHMHSPFGGRNVNSNNHHSKLEQIDEKNKTPSRSRLPMRGLQSKKRKSIEGGKSEYRMGQNIIRFDGNSAYDSDVQDISHNKKGSKGRDSSEPPRRGGLGVGVLPLKVSAAKGAFRNSSVSPTPRGNNADLDLVDVLPLYAGKSPPHTNIHTHAQAPTAHLLNNNMILTPKSEVKGGKPPKPPTSTGKGSMGELEVGNMLHSSLGVVSTKNPWGNMGIGCSISGVLNTGNINVINQNNSVGDLSDNTNNMAFPPIEGKSYETYDNIGPEVYSNIMSGNTSIVLGATSTTPSTTSNQTTNSISKTKAHHSTIQDTGKKIIKGLNSQRSGASICNTPGKDDSKGLPVVSPTKMQLNNKTNRNNILNNPKIFDPPIDQGQVGSSSGNLNSLGMRGNKIKTTKKAKGVGVNKMIKAQGKAQGVMHPVESSYKDYNKVTGTGKNKKVSGNKLGVENKNEFYDSLEAPQFNTYLQGWEQEHHSDDETSIQELFEEDKEKSINFSHIKEENLNMNKKIRAHTDDYQSPDQSPEHHRDRYNLEELESKTDFKIEVEEVRYKTGIEDGIENITKTKFYEICKNNIDDFDESVKFKEQYGAVALGEEDNVSSDGENISGVNEAGYPSVLDNIKAPHYMKLTEEKPRPFSPPFHQLNTKSKHKSIGDKHQNIAEEEISGEKENIEEEERDENYKKYYEQKKNDEMVDVIYDPVFKCYYDPKTKNYYELDKTSIKNIDIKDNQGQNVRTNLQ